MFVGFSFPKHTVYDYKMCLLCKPLTFVLSILMSLISILETVHIRSVNALALDRQMIAYEDEVFRKTLLQLNMCS